MSTLKTNMTLNVIRSLMNIIAPLITFPYITRVLGVEVFGKVAFADSIVAYFIIMADLGVKMYAIGRGPALREKEDDIRRFASSVFTINVLSTLVSFLMLTLIIWTTPQLKDYVLILSVLSLQVLLTTIGVEWIFLVYEDYKYITIRTLIIRILFIFSLFAFVKKNSDVYVYTFLIVASTFTISAINYIHARRYCKISLTRHIDFHKHLKPILLLFSTQAAIMIYISSDTTILGFLCGPIIVGIYAVSAKLYSILKSIVAAIVEASIPRMSATYGSKDLEAFVNTGKEAYSTMVTIIVPLIVGTIVLAPSIIDIIAGEEYYDAVLPVRILAVSLFFCIGAYFWGQAILVPIGKENLLFRATLMSGGLNLFFNFLLIPLWEYNAAALTTLGSEAFTFFYCRYKSRPYLMLPKEFNFLFKCIIGSSVIIVLSFIVGKINLPLLVNMAIIVVLSIISYGVIECKLNNEIVIGLMKKLKNGIM